MRRDYLRYPLRQIVRRYANPSGTLMEELECGHVQEQPRDIRHRPRKAVRRRCRKCAPRVPRDQ